MKPTLALEYCRRRLLTVWVLGSALPFVIFVVQTLSNVFGSKTVEAWGWFSATIAPTLGMMVGAFVATRPGEKKKQPQNVTATTFRLAAGFSIAYLALVLCIILYEPYATETLAIGSEAAAHGAVAGSPEARMALLQRGNLPLGMLQGIVAALLGVFFAGTQTDVK